MKNAMTGILGLLLLGLAGTSEAYTIVSQGLTPTADYVPYTASHVWTDATNKVHSADLAFDGDWSNSWNSGVTAFASPWIEVNLGVVREITRIVLAAEQLPKGVTNHQIWYSTTGSIGNGRTSATKAYTLLELTDTNSILTIDFNNPITAQYLQVLTLRRYGGDTCPSWVAWNEIQIMTGREALPEVPEPPPHAPEPATILLFSAGMAGIFGLKFRKRQSAQKDQTASRRPR